MTYADEDWEDDNVDLSADPTETYPLVLATWNGGATVTDLVDNTSGSKIDNLSSVAKLDPKPGTDIMFKPESAFMTGVYRSTYGYWQHNGQNVLVLPYYISDRITGRPAKIVKMIRCTGPASGTNRGAFNYTTTPVVQDDFHVECDVNGTVTVDVLAGATGGGGAGTYKVDAPGAAAVTGTPSGYIEHAKVRLSFSGTNNKDVTITPHLDATGTEEVYVFIFSHGQFKTVKISVLIGGDEADLGKRRSWILTSRAADHANANTIGVTLLPPPDMGGSQVQAGAVFD